MSETSGRPARIPCQYKDRKHQNTSRAVAIVPNAAGGHIYICARCLTKWKGFRFNNPLTIVRLDR